jgi:hypothetical protein
MGFRFFCNYSDLNHKEHKEGTKITKKCKNWESLCAL